MYVTTLKDERITLCKILYKLHSSMMSYHDIVLCKNDEPFWSFFSLKKITML